MKTWVNRLTSRLDHIDTAIVDLRLALAENKGKDEGQKDLVWREINTDKQKIVRLESKMDKAWEVLSKLVPPRHSDILSRTEDDK